MKSKDSVFILEKLKEIKKAIEIDDITLIEANKISDKLKSMKFNDSDIGAAYFFLLIISMFLVFFIIDLPRLYNEDYSFNMIEYSMFLLVVLMIIFILVILISYIRSYKYYMKYCDHLYNDIELKLLQIINNIEQKINT
jgi:TM2 domain-containing membrane protein YozV